MPAKVDYTGQKFGKLLAIERIANSGGKTKYRCQCECGNEVIVVGSNLKTGNTKGCGKCNVAHNKLDLSQQKFGRLTAIELETVETNGQSIWKCYCECGNIVSVRLGALRSGKTRSCGCLGKENLELIQNKPKDLTNQRFGKLTVITQIEERKNHRVMWLCKCDCGSEKIISANSLLTGHTQSCGCLKSKGELKISNILFNNNIIYEVDKTFPDCTFESDYLARFDFYVNNSYIIEYDGQQHYEIGTGYFDNEESFYKRQKHDKIKNQYCFDHNIPIIRIPYTELENITLEMLQPETSIYLLREPGSSNG